MSNRLRSGPWIRAAWFASFAAPMLLSASGLWPAGASGIFAMADPLLALAGGVSARATWMGMLAALSLCAFTAAFGRLFCGWACPLGIVLDGVSARRRRGPRLAVVGYLGGVRYGVLALVLMPALAGGPPLYWLDPICLMTLAAGAVGYPWATQILSPALAGALGRSRVVSESGPVVGILAAILVLEWVAPRLWCRVLCPLGALLSLFARSAIRRRTVSSGCTSCGQCASECPGGAIDATGRRTSPDACLQCGRCRRGCEAGAVRFGVAREVQSVEEATVDESRRQFVRTTVLGAAAGAGMAGGLAAGRRPVSPEPVELRPPGSLPEADFIRRCVRCGACVAACPTNTLRPASLWQGLRMHWTPVPAMRIAGCDPSCSVCGRVCPSGAIRRLAPEERRAVRIGTAEIDRRECLPWASGQPCDVCIRECAYQGYGAIAADAAGRPELTPHRCAGCGWCEFRCPVGRYGRGRVGPAAVRVRPDRQDRIARGSYRAMREKERAEAATRARASEDTRDLLPSFLRNR